MALNDRREKIKFAETMLREYPPGSEHYEAALEYLTLVEQGVKVI